MPFLSPNEINFKKATFKKVLVKPLLCPVNQQLIQIIWILSSVAVEQVQDKPRLHLQSDAYPNMGNGQTHPRQTY